MRAYLLDQIKRMNKLIDDEISVGISLASIEVLNLSPVISAIKKLS